ncbi:hypothetical protein V8C26DRAFT_400327, partial [Trichoderma gracile]
MVRPLIRWLQTDCGLELLLGIYCFVAVLGWCCCTPCCSIYGKGITSRVYGPAMQQNMSRQTRISGSTTGSRANL